MLNNNNLGLSKDWPVNANLDLALEILQPIKVKQTLPNKEMVNRGNECGTMFDHFRRTLVKV